MRNIAWFSVAVVVASSGDARAFDSDGTQAPPEPWEATPVETARVRSSAPSGDKGFDIEIGGFATYLTPPIRRGTNPFGVGFGGRVGVAISGFYAGISAADFLGGRDVDVTYQSALYGAEVGYGPPIRLFEGGVLVLRPQVGVGMASVSYTDPSLAKVDAVTSASGRSSSSSNTITVNNVYVQPALVAMFSTSVVFVAVDGSALVLPGITYGGADATTWISYGLSGQAGFRF